MRVLINDITNSMVEMRSMMKRPVLVLIVSCVLAALACGGLPPAAASTPVPTANHTAAPISASATAPATAPAAPTTAAASASAPATIVVSTAFPTESPTAPPPTAVPSPTEPAVETYLAYAQDKNLFVAHVIGGQAVDTRQYTEPDPNGWIMSLAWSPSGEYLAFERLTPDSFPHAFYVNVFQGGPPVDLGISSGLSWSADSKLLAFGHEYDLWVHSVENGQSRRLTTHRGFDWLWSSPAFAPGGDALVAAGAVSDDMGRYGITRYKLYQVPLDGSAANSSPSASTPGLTPEIIGIMPGAIRFSPDGQKLAFTTTVYIDGCATHAEYYVANADGSDLRLLPVASLAALGTADGKIYFFGDSLAWTPDSAGLWVNGLVTDCARFTGLLGGPQVSRVTLDGAEHEIIPGDFKSVSLDRTGTLVAVIKKTGLDTTNVQILRQDGHLVLDLGEGTLAALQP